MQILEEAQEATGLEDFGEYNNVEEWTGLLVDNLNRVGGEYTVKHIVSHSLRTRLQVVAAKKTHSIRHPVFVIGVPRTGTTILYELLNLSPSLRAHVGFDSRYPINRNKQTFEKAVKLFDKTHMLIPDLLYMHPRYVDWPDELQWLTEHSMQCYSWALQFPIWEYQHAVEMSSMVGPFQFVKDAFSVLNRSARWLLKAPTDLGHIHDLITVFPDAKFIWTHRDPIYSVPSLCSLLRAIHKGTSGYPTPDLGLKALGWITRDLAIGHKVAQANPERIIHINHEDLLERPHEVLSYISEQIGISDIDSSDIDSYLKLHPKPLQHKYWPEQFGLNDGIIRGVLGELR